MRTKLRYGESLTVTMSGAATTTNPTYSVDYVTGGDTDASAFGSLTGATAKTVVSGTDDGAVVSGLSICNIDTAAVTVTLNHVNSSGTSTKIVAPLTLQVNDTLMIDANGQISVIDANGKLKSGNGTAVVSIPIPFSAFRVHDANATNLPATSSSDDMALVLGTDGTNFASLQSADFKNTTTATYARALVNLPSDYVDGSAVTLRLTSGMKTTVASSACTVDANVYSNDGDTTGSADICTTDAQSINSLTFANKDFVITPTGLVAGQALNIKLAFAGTDSATATAVIAAIAHAELRTTCYR